MTVFQIIAVAVLGLFALATLVNMIRSRRAVGALWLAIWTAAAAAIVEPDLTTSAAHFLGIVRGADLVFYCAVIGGLLGFFFVYVRLRSMKRQITILTRKMAIANAERPAVRHSAKDGAHGDGEDGR
mgnify:CR=1 FL=1